MDSVTLERIKKAHPKVRTELGQIFTEINQRLTGNAKCRFSHVLRTFAEQDALYAQGRSKPGKVVTWARGGQSYHNYGLAVDIVLIIDTKEASWNTVADFDRDGVSDWMECVAVFKKYGWEWGGSWARPKTDMPHFQKTFGYSVGKLLSLHGSNKVDGQGYVVI